MGKEEKGGELSEGKDEKWLRWDDGTAIFDISPSALLVPKDAILDPEGVSYQWVISRGKLAAQILTLEILVPKPLMRIWNLWLESTGGPISIILSTNLLYCGVRVPGTDRIRIRRNNGVFEISFLNDRHTIQLTSFK